MSDMTQDFDGPVIEPVKGIGDVKFSRATMEYWSGWATGLKAKRIQQLTTEINKLPNLNPLSKAETLARAQAVNVQIFELLDQQYTPDGIAKILLDGYTRAGGDASKWPDIARRIGPGRQQALASEICSEPKPTSQELRESLRDLLRKARRQAPPGIDNMSDEELIAAAREFSLPPEKTEDRGGGNGDPLADSQDGSEPATGRISAALPI